MDTMLKLTDKKVGWFSESKKKPSKVYRRV